MPCATPRVRHSVLLTRHLKRCPSTHALIIPRLGERQHLRAGCTQGRPAESGGGGGVGRGGRDKDTSPPLSAPPWVVSVGRGPAVGGGVSGPPSDPQSEHPAGSGRGSAGGRQTIAAAVTPAIYHGDEICTVMWSNCSFRFQRELKAGKSRLESSKL